MLVWYLSKSCISKDLWNYIDSIDLPEVLENLYVNDKTEFFGHHRDPNKDDWGTIRTIYSSYVYPIDKYLSKNIIGLGTHHISPIEYKISEKEYTQEELKDFKDKIFLRYSKEKHYLYYMGGMYINNYSPLEIEEYPYILLLKLIYGLRVGLNGVHLRNDFKAFLKEGNEKPIKQNIEEANNVLASITTSYNNQILSHSGKNWGKYDRPSIKKQYINEL